MRAGGYLVVGDVWTGASAHASLRRVVARVCENLLARGLGGAMHGNMQTVAPGWESVSARAWRAAYNQGLLLNSSKLSCKPLYLGEKCNFLCFEALGPGCFVKTDKH